MKIIIIILCLFLTSSIAAFGKTPSSFGIPKFGQYTVNIMPSGGMVYALTGKGEDIFGLICNTKTQTCGWVVLSTKPCDEDIKYVVLISADTVSKPTEMICRHTPDAYVFIFTDSDLIDSIVKAAPVIGIATATADGTFKTRTFSLEGAIEAENFAESIAMEMKPRPTPEHDPNFVLM